ncbi:MAG: hypothetical protein OEL89_04985 [Candidatus Peregrinibacteria bacterium]|nr:hypothetical protein [Candidatus Peregrinibacteria bacterium]
MWEILDDYYKKLPPKKVETEDDKTWRCYLHRMDLRGMNPELKKTGQSTEIHWKTDIDPELKKFSEEGLKQASKPLEHTSLAIWASLKMRKDEKFKEYEKYEKDPKIALKEAQKIADKLSQINKPEKYQTEQTPDENFHLVNSSIPTDVCSVLVRDHLEILTKKEKEYCKNTVMDSVSTFLKNDFNFEISDRARSALQAFPNLLIEFPEERAKIKILLLLSLFNNHSVDMAGTSFSIFPTLAIYQLWKDYFDDAQSLLLGYILLKPKYEKLRKQIREDNYKKGNYRVSEDELIKRFLKKHKKDVDKIVSNELERYDLKNLDLNSLQTAFHLIPLENRTNNHEQLSKDIIEIFSKTLLSTEREDRVDYHTRHDFSRRLASFVLTSPKKKIHEYLKPFLDDFNVSEGMSELLEAFITVEDYLGKYENFWEVWNLFKKKIIESHEKRNGDWYISKVIENYLFGKMPWKESATDWHSLKDENKPFFSEVSQKLGSSPSTLYSISKLLNDIGSNYLPEGVFWISKMLKDNPDLKTAKLEVNTVYYLENLVRKYIYENREKVRRNKKTRDDILVILDFLLEKGSVIGYILRESIL